MGSVLMAGSCSHYNNIAEGVTLAFVVQHALLTGEGFECLRVVANKNARLQAIGDQGDACMLTVHVFAAQLIDGQRQTREGIHRS